MFVRSCELSTANGQFDPVFDAQAVFRMWLGAMARPGTVARVPIGDPRCPLPMLQSAAALLLTVLDHEVAFAVEPPSHYPRARDTLVAYLSAATESRPRRAEEADFVLAWSPLPQGLLLRLRRGTPAYPDRGGTLLMRVPDLSQAQSGPAVSLDGPGIRPGSAVRLGGLTPADLVDLAAVNSDPPLGIDVVLIDGVGMMTCLPRSTRTTLSVAVSPSGRVTEPFAMKGTKDGKLGTRNGA